MFYEKLDCIEFDHAKLVEEVKRSVFPLGQQVIQGEEYETKNYRGFGGWSLQSKSGDWQDGFEFFQTPEGKALEMFYPKDTDNYKALKFFNIAHSLEHKNPTQAYVGEIKRVLDQIEALGLYPRRARVTCLQAHCKSLVHTDGNFNEYIARIHIPLITNPKCVFICDGVNLYMEPGSVYIVWVNTWHQIRNDSDEDRYHIIMDAYDTRGVTQGFKYQGDIKELEEYALEYRKKIEETVITPQEYEQFETARLKFVTNPKKG